MFTATWRGLIVIRDQCLTPTYCSVLTSAHTTYYSQEKNIEKTVKLAKERFNLNGSICDFDRKFN